VDEFVLPKLLLVRLLIAVSVVVLLARWLEQGTVTWKRTPLDVPLLAFIGSAVLSTVFATNRNVAIFATYDRWEGLITIASYGWAERRRASGGRGADRGLAVVVMLRHSRFHVWPRVISITVLVVGFATRAGIAAAPPSSGGSGIGQALIARIGSIADLSSGTE